MTSLTDTEDKRLKVFAGVGTLVIVAILVVGSLLEGSFWMMLVFPGILAGIAFWLWLLSRLMMWIAVGKWIWWGFPDEL